MKSSIKKILLLTLLISSCAFAKAGYDNFGITIQDPLKNYTGQIEFKYDCLLGDHGQKTHSLQAARVGSTLMGSSEHNLICPGSGDHSLEGIILTLHKSDGSGAMTKKYLLSNAINQRTNSWLECERDYFGAMTCHLK